MNTEAAAFAFWSQVVVEDCGCWEWEGRTTRQQYGLCAKGSVYRFVYSLVHGPQPKGMHLDHTCSNPRCCNPAHLEVVPPVVNLKRSHPFGPGTAERHRLKYIARKRWIRKGLVPPDYPLWHQNQRVIVMVHDTLTDEQRAHWHPFARYVDRGEVVARVRGWIAQTDVAEVAALCGLTEDAVRGFVDGQVNAVPFEILDALGYTTPDFSHVE